jgi:isopenicillin N synthase-like dioxygenase
MDSFMVTDQSSIATVIVILLLVVNHDISIEDIRAMFDASHSFFELSENTKENYLMDYPRNAGWEKLSQV